MPVPTLTLVAGVAGTGNAVGAGAKLVGSVGAGVMEVDFVDSSSAKRSAKATSQSKIPNTVRTILTVRFI
jgi:microcompartment protein CcmK/EutM